MPGGPLEVGYGVSYLSIAIPVLGRHPFAPGGGAPFGHIG